jgi:molybdopterin converting factor small subunit
MVPTGEIPLITILCLNINSFSNEVAVEIIVKAAQAKGIEATAVELPAQLREEILTTKLDVAQLADADGSEETLEAVEQDKLPEFAHPSEREFARVMDFYRIRWQYEPKNVSYRVGRESERCEGIHAGLLSA